MVDKTQPTKMPQLDPAFEIQRLLKTATDLTEKLRSHRDKLSYRGMTTPAGALETLQSIVRTLQQLEGEIAGQQGVQIEVQQLRELARTTELINSSLDLDPVLDDVIDTVISLT